MLALGILLAGVVLVVENLEFKQETRTKASTTFEWQLYYQTNFNNLDGWDVNEREGEVTVTNGWARLRSSGRKYPVISRRNDMGGLLPASEDFKIETKIRFNKPSGVAGYGVSGWGGRDCGGNFKEFFGLTWHKSNGFELRLFNKTRKLPADTNVHVLELIKAGSRWTVKLDGNVQLTGSDPNPGSCPRPNSFYFGDPTTQEEAIWPILLIDYFKVFKKTAAEKPGTLPEEEMLTFVAIGDTHAGVDPTRTGSDTIVNQREAANYNHQQAVEKISAIKPDFYLHLGDLVDKPNSSYYEHPERVEKSTFPWDEFFQIEAGLIADKNNPVVPIYPTIGNHEYYHEAKSYYGRFSQYTHLTGLLQKDQPWYSFDRGDAHFVSLWIDYDGNPGNVGTHGIAGNDAQYQWLENDLKNASKPWKIVFCHVSLNSSRSNAIKPEVMKMKNLLHPLFQQYGVDLVIGAHDHFYERVVDEGVTYITSGGGSNAREIIDPAVPGKTQVLISKNHIVKFTVDADTLIGTAIETRAKGCQNYDWGGSCVWWSRAGGGILDSFTLSK